MDRDRDGQQELIVKFSRAALIDLLQDQTGAVSLTVTGNLADGTYFTGRCDQGVSPLA